MSCFSPFIVKQDDRRIPVPCGKCAGCTARRASAWSFRLMQEDKVSETSFFVTLTYDNENVPISSNGFLSLEKSHFNEFIKKLRNRHRILGGRDPETGRILRPIKYFACGEYGGRFHRPHYHVILFNASLTILIGAKYAKAFYAKSIELEGSHPFSSDIWDKGHITVGTVSEASVGYSLKYITKAGKVPIHARDDRVPEFQRMSKKLGISYVRESTIAWHMNDKLERVYLNIEDGKKIAMPRYYKEKIYGKDLSEVMGYLKGKMEREQIERDKILLLSGQLGQAMKEKAAAIEAIERRRINKPIKDKL